MMTRALRASATLLAVVALVMAATSTPALAAKKDKKDKKAEVSTALVESLKGKQFRMADTKMAPTVTRIADAAGDQRTSSGLAAPDAPTHSDLVNVYVASTEMPRKLLDKMDKDFPRGTAGSWHGADAAWTDDSAVVFVAATMARKRPDGAGGQQLEVGLDGDAAFPVQVNSAGDSLAGMERFSLSGIFNNGVWSSGTTDISGREPGGEIDWYNTVSGVFGFYDPKRATYYAVIPRTADAQSVSVAVRTSTEAGAVVDRLQAPGGGTFIDLRKPAAGLSKKSGLSPLTCRALETFSAETADDQLVDPSATLIRYTAGMDALATAEEVDQIMAPAFEAVGAIPLLVSAVGSDEAPLQVDGELARADGGTLNAVRLTLEVPAGQWSFAPAEGAQVTLPNGEALLDHRSLTGASGVLTGEGLDGVVAGDPSCGQDGLELASDSVAGAEVDLAE